MPEPPCGSVEFIEVPTKQYLWYMSWFMIILNLIASYPETEFSDLRHMLDFLADTIPNPERLELELLFKFTSRWWENDRKSPGHDRFAACSTSWIWVAGSWLHKEVIPYLESGCGTIRDHGIKLKAVEPRLIWSPGPVLHSKNWDLGHTMAW